MTSRWLLLIAVLMLNACGSRRPAPVDEVNTRHKTLKSQSLQHRKFARDPDYYYVKKGDSLYSIGFRYQLDYRQLAAINNISPPYRIYPNQRLTLKADVNSTAVSETSKTTVTQAVKTQPQLSVQKETSLIVIDKPTQSTNSHKPVTVKTDQKPVVKPVQESKPITSKTPVVKAAEKPTAQVLADMPDTGTLNWLWPTAGEIRTTFSSSNPSRKGISIRGKEGQPVKASERGVVVYSGDGLLGYGELIIIKHNDTYLSAYGHNKKRNVTEGQQVKRGDVIAQLGSSGTNINNLHFEIRKNGQPVNPLDYVKP